MAKFILTAFADEAGKSLDEQIAALHRNHMRYIEPRMVDGVNLMDLPIERVKEIRKKLDEAGITVSSLGSPIGKYDIHDDFAPHMEAFRHALEVCHILGTTRMRMFDFFVPQEELANCRAEVLERLQAMLIEAKEAGVTLCLENESRIYSQMPAQQKDSLEALPEQRGVFDAAKYIMNDADVMEGIAATLPTLEYVHIKDASYEEKTILPAGEGDGQIGRILRMVDEAREGDVFLTVDCLLYTSDAADD